MGKALVSIIVPTYNGEKCIKRCLKSLLMQSYSEIEILVVDDESTDRTSEKVKELENEDPRIKYYKINHSGVSVARNYGLSIAKGKYIMFADGDDYTEPDFVQKMVESMEDDDSIVLTICRYNRVISGQKYPIKKMLPSGKRSCEKYLVETLADPGHHYFGVVWNKIFRSEIIQKSNLRFKEHISLGEDFIFSLEYLTEKGSVNVVEDKIYNYCYQERSSLSRVLEKNIKDCQVEFENRKSIFKVYKNTFKERNIYNKYKSEIYKYWIVFFNRQNYSLKHEYNWSFEDKEGWKKQISEYTEIEKARHIVPGIYIHGHYILFLISQSLKKILKVLIEKMVIQ